MAASGTTADDQGNHGAGAAHRQTAGAGDAAHGRGGGRGAVARSSPPSRRRATEQLDELIKQSGQVVPDDQYERIKEHLSLLPTRYVMEVRDIEDVLTHIHLLESARATADAAISTRYVSVSRGDDADARVAEELAGLHLAEAAGGAAGTEPLSIPMQRGATSLGDDNAANTSQSSSLVRPPTFGSSLNLVSLDSECDDVLAADSRGNSYSGSCVDPTEIAYEVTIALRTAPKVLSKLSIALSDIGLNIQEAHALSTNDGYALDVFVVTGWAQIGCDELSAEVKQSIIRILEGTSKVATVSPPAASAAPPVPNAAPQFEKAVPDEWEIEPTALTVYEKVASGSFGNLYRGSYRGQLVAIKVLKVHDGADQQELVREFMHELSVLRRVRHKHIVQLIGACTSPPKLGLVTEFMSHGSVHDYMMQKAKQGQALKLPMLLKVAGSVAQGLDYLHKNNIIHRDVKAANLLMDENDVVKVADFGVARVHESTSAGVLTAETGTYRWMAPEVIAHKEYGHKCDVYSYGILLWELVTNGAVPYAGYTPLQAAVGVVQKGLRPEIPANCPRAIAELMRRCWAQDAVDRPEFSEVITMLNRAAEDIANETAMASKEKKPGLFTRLKRMGK